MPNPTIHFISPSEFILDGEGVQKWRESLAVKVPGCEFTPLYKRKLWDGMHRPGSRDKQARLHLKRGFFENAISATGAMIVDPPEIPPLAFPDISGIELRDYQEESLRKIYDKRWGRIALATNAGKGAIISLAAKGFATSGWTTLILVDEIAVFDALEKEIEVWTHRKPFLLKAGVKEMPRKGAIVLAMVPTLSRRLKDEEWTDWLASVDAVLLDEADKASSTSWQNLLTCCKNTHVRIGFSGTFADDNTVEGLKLAETLGPVLVRVKNAELIRRGISVKPMVELYPIQHTLVLPEHQEWKSMVGIQRRLYVFEHCVANNVTRHEMVRSLLHPDYPNSIVVNYISHGEALANYLPGSVFLHGKSSKETRDGVLDAFQRGDFQHLITTKILDRGTNRLGHSIGLIFASGEGSERQTLQRIGRGLRLYEGKEYLFLRDIIDRVRVISAKGRELTASKPTFLENAGVRRIILYNEEEFDVRIFERTTNEQPTTGVPE